MAHVRVACVGMSMAVVTAALLLSAACAETSPDLATRETPASTASPDATPRTSAVTPSAQKCFKPRRRLIHAAYVQVRLWVEGATAGQTDLTSSGGSDLRTYDLTHAEVPQQCRFPKSRMAGILRAAQDLDEHPTDLQRRTALLRLWNSWARSTGAEHLVRALRRDMRACAAFRDQVRVSYRVHSEPTLRGKDVSIELVVDNGLTYEAVVVMYGSLVAHDVLPRAPRAGREPRDQTIEWGGLESDEVGVAPHDVRAFRQNLGPNKQHLSLARSGHVSQVRPHAHARENVTGRGCTVPVPPAH